MSETQKISGSCLCKSVTITANTASKAVGVCHCNMCRKESSGPFFAVACGTDVEIQGQDKVTTYDSSAWAERGFCNKCGSNLFYRLKADQRYMVSAGLFSEKFIFDHEVFVDEMPGYYNFANQTEKMTGPEVFAKFS